MRNTITVEGEFDSVRDTLQGRAVSLFSPLPTKQALPRWPAPPLKLSTRVHPAGASSSGEYAGGARKMISPIQHIHMQHPPQCSVIRTGVREETAHDIVNPAKAVSAAQRFAGFKRLLRFSRHERKDTFDDMALGYGGV